MDERLEAGRHHLVNGSRALEQGYPDDARAHYTAALLQFRGPELRLGEAHALRGLARVALAQGEESAAAGLAERAIRAYADLAAELQRIDPEHLGDDIRVRGIEGEAAAWIVLTEARVRLGDTEGLEDVLTEAWRLADSVQHTGLLADVTVARASLALREGRVDESVSHLERARALHESAGSGAGQAGALLLIAGLHRWRGEGAAALHALERAGPLANAQGSDRLLGRVAHARALLALDAGAWGDAEIGFRTALPVLGRAGAFELVGQAWLGLAEVASQTGAEGLRAHVGEALRRYAAVGSVDGQGALALLLADHALRGGEPLLGVLASECARRLWRSRDPVRGGGQALRLMTRALAALGRARAAAVAAELRARVAGADQPGAVEVARWHRGRIPKGEASDLDPLDATALEAELIASVEALLAEKLDRAGLTLDAISGATGARAALELLIEQVPEIVAGASVAPEIVAPPLEHPDDRGRPTGAFGALGADRAGRASTPSPAPPRRAYHPPRGAPEEEER